MKACDVPVGCIFSYKEGEYLVIYSEKEWQRGRGAACVCCLVLKPMDHPRATQELHLTSFSSDAEVTLI